MVRLISGDVNSKPKLWYVKAPQQSFDKMLGGDFFNFKKRSKSIL